MFPRVVEAYEQHGYRVDLGNPSRLLTSLVDQSTRGGQDTGGGISVSDALLLAALARVMSPAGVFIIGNSFGLSTFVLAELFPGAKIDVIDAEVEGAHNRVGSAVTRKIIASHFNNVQLTVGFSPGDVPRAMRLAKYQFAFIDGLHTNEQMLADFRGLLPYLDESAAVVFHDVAICRMFEAWRQVQSEAGAAGFRPFEIAFTQFGVTVISRGLPQVERYLESVSGKFDDERYHLGIAPHAGSRPRFWIKSPYEIELYLRRKMGLAGK